MPKTSIRSLLQRRKRLLKELTAIGNFRQGSLSEMYRKCGKPCSCTAKGHPGHGPTWVWSRHAGGRTRSATIPEADVPKVRQQVDEYRRFRNLCRELSEVSSRLCETQRLTEGHHMTPAGKPAGPNVCSGILPAVVVGLLLSAAPILATAEERPEVLIITAHPLGDKGLAAPATLLDGKELDRARDVNLGATLSSQPGIHQAAFGTVVGRPVVHGLAGPRVRIMQDRLDTMDVSIVSADHAVAVESFIAERIEVLRGPSVLLYGTGAIGGAVNVLTGRIPQLPAEGLSGGTEARHNSATGGDTVAFKLNGGKGGFAWHLDGATKDGDDYDIPGHAESARLRAQEEDHDDDHDDDDHEEEEARDKLPGSRFESDSIAGGAAWHGDWGFAGFAVSRMESDYGLPGPHGHHHEEDEEENGEEHEEEGNATLDMEQTRLDFELGLQEPFAGIDRLNMRVGYSDYMHVEIEPGGHAGTKFSNDAWEARAEFHHAAGPWKGAAGLQYAYRDFEAVGEESFVPPVLTNSAGAFWVGRRTYEAFDLEAGVRLERVSHNASTGSDKDFTIHAASVGALVPLGSQLNLGLLASHSSRAPIAEELYADGPHLVLNTYEIGTIGLSKERAATISLRLQYAAPVWDAAIATYFTRFSDYIYQSATGREVNHDGYDRTDCNRVYSGDTTKIQTCEAGLHLREETTAQEDAEFFGIDAEASAQIASWPGGEARLHGKFDYVDAKLSIGGNDRLPRIPPLRYGVGLSARWNTAALSIDYLRAEDQDETAAHELATDGYDDLSVHATLELPAGEGATLEFFLHGKNLTDDEQRLHTSYIKDYAPQPGRTFEVGARLRF